MKLRFLLLLLLLGSTAANAQNITGIWRGYFNSGYGYLKQQYKYEVQINQLSNKSIQKGIQGVTYSYHTTVFYGKATLQGIYDAENKTLTIKELKLVELKASAQTEPCLMTCYLDYRKEGKTEIMEGTFTSVNVNTKGDCGSGYVYLEKVEESDFLKEDFLIKKTKPATKPAIKDSGALVKTTPKPKTNTPDKKPKTIPPVVKKTTPPVIKKTTPPVVKKTTPNTNTTQKPKPGTGKDTIVKAAPVMPLVPDPSDKIITKKELPIPELIKDRDNPLIKKIFTNSADILVQLYDNGEIDGDTITVYDNNEVIAYHKGLTKAPITINLKATVDNPVHEIVMVANNLGQIPPNTALMVVTTGGKRYEIFLSSDEKKNAKVVIALSMDRTPSK